MKIFVAQDYKLNFVKNMNSVRIERCPEKPWDKTESLKLCMFKPRIAKG